MLSCARLHQIGQIARIIRESKPKDDVFSATFFRRMYGSSVKPHQVKEIRIPVPYGNLMAKSWGSDTGYPVLALHGWLDNCGTFDKLMPMLSNSLNIIALDLPGHGRSSHKPPGNFYSVLDMMVDIRRVTHFFKWEKFHIIGHSFGGALSLVFCSQFSNLIDKLVVLDLIKPPSIAPEDLGDVYSRVIEQNLEIETKIFKGPPIYTRESAIKRLVEGMHNEISEDSAAILIERGTRPSDCGKGLVFSRDLRMRFVESFNMMSHEGVKSLMQRIKNEFLLIRATDPSPFYTSCYPRVDDFIEIYEQSSKHFIQKFVEGNHFVHLNNPERIAPLINEFLCEKNESS